MVRETIFSKCTMRLPEVQQSIDRVATCSGLCSGGRVLSKATLKSEWHVDCLGGSGGESRERMSCEFSWAAGTRAYSRAADIHQHGVNARRTSMRSTQYGTEHAASETRSDIPGTQNHMRADSMIGTTGHSGGTRYSAGGHMLKHTFGGDSWVAESASSSTADPSVSLCGWR